MLTPHVSQYMALYKRSIEDPAGFWADIAEQFHWEKKVYLHHSFNGRPALTFCCLASPFS